MDKKVIFIHKSEIIAKGLQSIVNSSLNMDLVHICNISDVLNYSNLNDSYILFIVDKQLDPKVVFDGLIKLRKSNLTDLLWFDIGENADDSSINICNSSNQVVKIITDYLTRAGLYKERVEVHDLSDRELDVLKLVAKGFSSKDIADKLFISIHTVISHRKNITDKLGIKSISGLTVYAILNKYVDLSDIS